MHCIIPLCQQVRNIFRRENGFLGTENDAHENERFNPASRLCPSRVSLPSVLPHGYKERQTPTRGSSARNGHLLVPAARVRSISAHKERACLGRLPAGRPFCARAGGQCDPRTCRRRRARGSSLPRSGEELRLGVPGCRRSAVAASGHARDAASGVGRPVGGRPSARWEEDGTVGSHCAPRP